MNVFLDNHNNTGTDLMVIESKSTDEEKKLNAEIEEHRKLTLKIEKELEEYNAKGEIPKDYLSNIVDVYLDKTTIKLFLIGNLSTAIGVHIIFMSPPAMASVVALITFAALALSRIKMYIHLFERYNQGKDIVNSLDEQIAKVDLYLTQNHAILNKGDGVKLKVKLLQYRGELVRTRNTVAASTGIKLLSESFIKEVRPFGVVSRYIVDREADYFYSEAQPMTVNKGKIAAEEIIKEMQENAKLSPETLPAVYKSGRFDYFVDDTTKTIAMVYLGGKVASGVGFAFYAAGGFVLWAAGGILALGASLMLFKHLIDKYSDAKKTVINFDAQISIIDYLLERDPEHLNEEEWDAAKASLIEYRSSLIKVRNDVARLINMRLLSEAANIVPYNKGDLVDHSTSSAIVTDVNGKILIFYHHKIQCYTIPVGKVDPGQTPVEACIKECKEEIGINIKKLFLRKIADHEFTRDKKKVKVKAHIFEVTEYTGTPSNKEPKKHSDMQYVTLTQLKKMKNISDVTKEAIEYLSGGGEDESIPN